MLSLRSVLNKTCMRNGVEWSLTRNGHTLRGKRPGEARTLQMRLDEANAEQPKLLDRVNIGFPQLKGSRSEQLKKRIEHQKIQRADATLEKKARSNTLTIDLHQVQEEYKNSNGQHNLRVIADHYSIFSDLFGPAFFVPRVNLDITYASNADTYNAVYFGNIIKPSEAVQKPNVNFIGNVDPITGKVIKSDVYWTLIATNPDGNLKNNDGECLHWFVGNIPQSNVDKGDTIVEYLPPFPPRGIGYQRFVFILYMQSKKLDFSNYQLEKSHSNDLEKRTFKTFDFYKQYQDDITPAGLAFYQTNWDNSLTAFYHNVLNMKEPVYQYDFPKPYLTDQKFFPLKQPFDIYLDKHRDIKEINKEYLEQKLKATHPFDGPKTPLRFPNAHPIRDVPSWLRTKIRKERLGIGRINDY